MAGRARTKGRKRILLVSPVHGDFEVAPLEPLECSKRPTSLPLANEQTSGKVELDLTTNVSSPAKSFDYQTTPFLQPRTLHVADPIQRRAGSAASLRLPWG